MNRKVVLALASTIALVWRLLPSRVRRLLFTGMFVVESRGDVGKGMANLFLLRDKIDWVINERAIAYGNGEHPKHRLTKYHRFFVDRILPGERVLDVGCGYGAVARTIAREVEGSVVCGVEMDKRRYEQANSADNPPNLYFINNDARNGIPAEKWDVVVMSNVLEHIEDRVGMLRDLRLRLTPERILIRVPVFERDWSIPMREELDITFHSDATHFIEHKLPEFKMEMDLAGLKIFELLTVWGEIWADCRPVREARESF